MRAAHNAIRQPAPTHPRLSYKPHKPSMSLMTTAFASPLAPSRELQCGYRSKVCANVRATKLDGSLHKLCEFHRLKANSSQRRLQKRRQLRKLQEAAAGSGSEDAAPASPPAKRARLSVKSASPTTADDAALLYAPAMAATDLHASDVALLEQTLFSSASLLPPLYDAPSPVPAPLPLGMLDMDAVVSDVLREFSGPVSMPKLDAASGWYWTV